VPPEGPACGPIPYMWHAGARADGRPRRPAPQTLGDGVLTAG
jgi:hypothetical protein